ncbi:MAG TPA: 3-dehydroquinate synthase [Steroidobacteraceae bacterium]|nr:3-dehydroquinate synthase [Steroidobacteraceae bacterium]
MQTLKVDVGHATYPIKIGPGLLGDGELLDSLIPGRDLCVVTNTTVAGLFLEKLQATLAGGGNAVPPAAGRAASRGDARRGDARRSDARRIARCVLPDGERYKTLETVGRVFDALVDARLNRDCTIVALGGGVVGDIAGFAAACYQRGVGYVQIPTTLLAQVDSSVGGKTGVNHPGGKNLIGAFHQPLAVVADTDTLTSLPDRELRAGLAEVIKYGCIWDPLLFDWLELNIDHLTRRDPQALAYAIGRSCEIKAEVVARDERESNVRALLNFGHTFGHAIESATGYATYLHGEAVGLGMLMAAGLSHRLGSIDAAELVRIHDLLMRAGLPTEAPRIGVSRAQELMRMDKKVLAGTVRLVLLERLGRAVVTGAYEQAALDATLAEYCA